MNIHLNVYMDQVQNSIYMFGAENHQFQLHICLSYRDKHDKEILLH